MTKRLNPPKRRRWPAGMSIEAKIAFVEAERDSKIIRIVRKYVVKQMKAQTA